MGGGSWRILARSECNQNIFYNSKNLKENYLSIKVSRRKYMMKNTSEFYICPHVKKKKITITLYNNCIVYHKSFLGKKLINN